MERERDGLKEDGTRERSGMREVARKVEDHRSGGLMSTTHERREKIRKKVPASANIAPEAMEPRVH